MASNMVTALAAATLNNTTLFGATARRPQEEVQAWRHLPARPSSPGQKVRTTFLEIPQLRQTWPALGATVGGEWGLRHGMNDQGVAVGIASMEVRLEDDGVGLTGPDLVRLALERAAGAHLAVEIITDLISRHGQTAGEARVGAGNVFLIADPSEAFVLETCGSHWVLQECRAVRAVSGVCHLRQDWDRISHGLADLAIQRGWWPADGSKLDFAAALGRQGRSHEADLHRWGHATWVLEQNRGRIDLLLLRRALAGPVLATVHEGGAERSSLLAQLSVPQSRPSLAWCAFGPIGYGLSFPLCPLAELPKPFLDENGNGSPLWRQVSRWQGLAASDTNWQSALREGMAAMQERFDQNAQEFLAEAADLTKRGRMDEVPRLAASFMQHNLDHFELFAADLESPIEETPAPASARTRADDLAEIPGGYF